MTISITDVKNYIEKYTSGDKYQYLVDFFKPLDIMVKLSQDSETTAGIFILSSKNRPGKLHHPIQLQSKGMIFKWEDDNSVRVLAASSLYLQRRLKLADDIYTNPDYKVYKISDGTLLNLYYNNGWKFGTTNGWDVSNIKWTSTKTFAEMFTELAVGYPEFSLDSLDKSKSYVIGMRHHSIHPLTRDPQKLWMIQSNDLVALNAGADYSATVGHEDIGLPHQEPLDLRSYDIKQLYQDNREAAAEYFKSGAVWYGFIVVRNNSAAAIFDSNLLSSIRKYIYFLPKKTEISLNFMLLRSYLSYNSRKELLSLFPQFSDRYDKFGKMISDIVFNVLMCLRDTSSREQLSAAADNRSKILLTYVKEFEAAGFNPHSGEITKIVQDTICNTQNAHSLYAILRDLQ